ncbi:MAG: DUF6288 domain-containing protein [Planctomycetota bacterium]
MPSCRSFLFSCLLLAALALSSLAQGPRRDKSDYYPLGGIGAQALPGSESGTIDIRRIHAKGPADKGKLKVGDRILKVNGNKLKGTGDPLIDAFCQQVMNAEAKKAPNKKTGILKLVVRRKGKEVKLAIAVAALGSFKGNTPAKCHRSQSILSDALKFLKATQDGDGKFKDVFANQNQGTAGAALAGPAFLGAGKKYKKNYQRALKYVKRHVLDDDDRMSQGGGANWNQTNWSLSYGAILLSESLAQKRSKETKSLLKKVVAKIQENQEQSGGWAHGPGGPNALKYLELEIMSNFCMAGMGMAERVGVVLDQDKRAKAIEYVKACTSGGGVAYSTRKGQAGHGDAGRTAGAYWAFRQLSRRGKTSKSMWNFVDREFDTLPQGHVSPAMHILNGALAAAVKGEKSYEKFWLLYRDYIMAQRDQDGAITSRPTKESRQLSSNSDRGNGSAFTTAHFVIAMQLSQNRYKLLDTHPAKN